jgi:hypothetical protein
MRVELFYQHIGRRPSKRSLLANWASTANSNTSRPAIARLRTTPNSTLSIYLSAILYKRCFKQSQAVLTEQLKQAIY